MIKDVCLHLNTTLNEDYMSVWFCTIARLPHNFWALSVQLVCLCIAKVYKQLATCQFYGKDVGSYVLNCLSYRLYLVL